MKKAFTRWLHRWRLRQIIRVLTHSIQEGRHPHVLEFVKSLEATELMSRGSSPSTEVSISVTRAQLDKFIVYTCALHDAKLSRITIARIGLACLCMTNAQMLGASPSAVIAKEEAARNAALAKQRIIKA